jgi:hypothetical protein
MKILIILSIVLITIALAFTLIVYWLPSIIK